MDDFWSLPHKHTVITQGVALILRHYWGHLGLQYPDPSNRLFEVINKPLWDFIEVVGPSPFISVPPFVLNSSVSDGQLRRLYNSHQHRPVQFADALTLVLWAGESALTTTQEKRHPEYAPTPEKLVVAMGAKICFMPFGKEMSRDIQALNAWWGYLDKGSLVAHFKAAVASESWLPIWLIREIARIRIHVDPSDDASDAFHLVHHRYGAIWEPEVSDKRAWLCANLLEAAMSKHQTVPSRILWESHVPTPPPVPFPPTAGNSR